jgi:hypothetical protein
LIVITGVLEYFSKRKTFVDARKKLSAALRPHGYLLVESTRSSPVAEEASWSKLLIRGKGINSFIAQDPTLSKVSEVLTERYAITLLQKDLAGSAE